MSTDVDFLAFAFSRLGVLNAIIVGLFLMYLQITGAGTH